MAYNPNRNPELPPKAGDENKTPAPTARSTSWGRTAYGANGFDGPSSTDKPGQTVTSPLADELKRASDDGEHVLDQVIAAGTARVDSEITSQLRSIGAGNVRDGYGMESARSRQPSSRAVTATIPVGLTDNAAEPVRKPSA